jgi:hypothetical protein
LESSNTSHRRPTILEQAQEIALPGDINSLSSAIIQARAIAKNRALYRDAQREIGGWQVRIERMEDQPISDQAQAFANLKDYSTAIETANQIPPVALFLRKRPKISVVGAEKLRPVKISSRLIN